VSDLLSVLRDNLVTIGAMMEVVLVYCLLLFLDMSMALLDCSVVEKSVNCSCENWYSSHEIFKISDLENITHHVDSQIENLSLTKCSKLRLELFPPYPALVRNILIKDMNHVVISLSKDMPHLNISIHNVLHIQYMPMEEKIETQQSSQSVVTYVAISLSVLLILALSIFLSILLWTWLSSKDNGDAKKVSRAQSWRYEASLYVNPPSQLHHQQPVLVQPPPFPDFILPSTSSRNEPPDSVTSSPMLRTKNNCMAEVDLVRTSLPVQRDRQRMDTPPAYREPVDSLAIYQDTFRTSDGEYSANEMLTLAHKYR